MRWPWKKKKQPPEEPNFVDFSRDRIPLNDPTDPTSMMLQLAMKGGAVAMTWDETAGVWVVTVDDSNYLGETQAEALQKALEAVA